jgi:hypothetical protein
VQRTRYGRSVNISSSMGAFKGMRGSDASRSIQEGADSPIWTATLLNNGPTGGFFRDRCLIS